MSEQDLLLIEQYYRGELGEAERLAFEQRMSMDDVFREESQSHQQAMRAIQLYGREELKKNLRERPFTKPTPFFRIWQILAIAGVVAVIIVFHYWFTQTNPATFFPSTPATPLPNDSLLQRDTPVQLPAVPQVVPPIADQKKAIEKLFAEAYRPYRDGSTEGGIRSGAIDTSKLTMDDVKQLVQEGKYAESLIAIERLPQEIQKKPVTVFFKANSLFALGRTETAAVLFEQVALNQQSAYAGRAGWYAALCALKKGDLPRAKKWLQTVATDNNLSAAERTEANRLLVKINSLPK